MAASAKVRYLCPVCRKQYDPASFGQPAMAKVLTPSHRYGAATCNGSGQTPNIERDDEPEWSNKNEGGGGGGGEIHERMDEENR